LQIGGIAISLWISGVSVDSLKGGLSLRN